MIACLFCSLGLYFRCLSLGACVGERKYCAFVVQIDSHEETKQTHAEMAPARLLCGSEVMECAKQTQFAQGHSCVNGGAGQGCEEFAAPNKASSAGPWLTLSVSQGEAYETENRRAVVLYKQTQFGGPGGRNGRSPEPNTAEGGGAAWVGGQACETKPIRRG